MIYKIYNESPEVGTAAKTLKYVICYNVCNMMEWGTRRAQMWHGQHSTPDSISRHQTGANVARGNTPHLTAYRGTRRAQMWHGATLHT